MTQQSEVYPTEVSYIGEILESDGMWGYLIADRDRAVVEKRLAPYIALLVVLLVLACLLLTAHPARGRHGAARDPRGTHGHPTPRKPGRGHTDGTNTTEGEPNR